MSTHIEQCRDFTTRPSIDWYLPKIVYNLRVGQFLLKVAGAVFGVAVFATLIWVSIFATDLEQMVTNPFLRFIIKIVIWSMETVVFAVVAYIVYLVIKQYADANTSFSQIKKHKKIPNPEFE